MKQYHVINFNKKYRYFPKEDVDSTKEFIELNLHNMPVMVEFYEKENHKNYIQGIGERGGVKHLGKRASRSKNPFLNAKQNIGFNNLVDYDNYLAPIREEAFEKNIQTKKVYTKSLVSWFCGLALGIITLFCFVIFLSLTLVQNSTGTQNILSPNDFLFWLLIVLLSLFFSLGVFSAVFGYKKALNTLWNEQKFYQQIIVLDKDTYIKLYQGVQYVNESKELKEVLWKQKPLDTNTITSSVIKNENQGIYLITVGKNFDLDKNYFLPIYVGQTINFNKRWNQHIQQLQKVLKNPNADCEQKYHKMRTYMMREDLSIKDLHFYILEENNLSNWTAEEMKAKETDWLIKTEAGSRGFNGVR